MLKRLCVMACLAASTLGAHASSYLTDDPNEVFADVYLRLGVTLNQRIARDPQVWVLLEELKREACDQKSVLDLGTVLDKRGYRRDAAESLYNFVRHCGAPHSALHRSVDIFLKLTDYPKAVEVADDFMRRAPTSSTAVYLRGVALQGVGDHRRAVTDYANAIELYEKGKKEISEHVFARLATAYSALGQHCEAATAILTWIAIDPVRRDNNASRKIVSDYEQRGNCATSTEFQKERFALTGNRHVVKVRAAINGVQGVFILDTGASYVTVKSSFAERAKIPDTGNEISLATANGLAKGKLTRAEKMSLGKLEARSVPVVVQKTDQKSYGADVDGLLGMSFLSRFEMQMAGGFIEVRSRRPK
jgi:clan AA aspartic protease (TIGR02281 family)